MFGEIPKMYCKIAWLCLLISVCQTRSEVNDSPHNEQSIPKDVPMKTIQISSDDEQLGLVINQSAIPSVRQGKEMLRKMCIRNAGNESYDKADLALKNMNECFNGIIDYAALPSKVESAKPIGELDSVFKEYCKRTEDLEGCVAKFLAEVDPCLAENQKSSKDTVQEITGVLLKFACEFEGDHLALFISEQGPECILSQQKGIQECIKTRIEGTKSSNLNQLVKNTTRANNITEIRSITQIKKLPEEPLSLDFGLDECRTGYDIRKCIIRELSRCSGSTPANVLESVFNLIKNSTTCSKFTDQQLDPDYIGSSAPVSFSSVSIIIPAFTILLKHFMS